MPFFYGFISGMICTIILTAVSEYAYHKIIQTQKEPS